MQAIREPLRPVQRRPGAVARVGAFALSCLLLLATFTSQAWGALLRDEQTVLATLAHAPALVVGGIGTVARSTPSVGHVHTTLVAPTGLHQYWQVGLVAGPEARNAVAMRTAIVTRLPQAVANHTTNYFWIGSYLADGSFIQVGYYVPWYDQQSAGWFYCAFTAAGTKGPCVYGPLGSAGVDGATHTYALETTPLADPDRVPASAVGPPMAWRALMDGAAIGHFVWTSGVTGPNSPSIYAESSGFAPHAATSQLGPVDFPVTVQTRSADQPEYASATHVRPVYAASDVCPPYGLGDDQHGGVLLGTGLPCPAADAWLW